MAMSMSPPILASSSTFASQRAAASCSRPPRQVVELPPINLWLCHHHPPSPLPSMVGCYVIMSSACSVVLGASSTPWSPWSSSQLSLYATADPRMRCHRPPSQQCPHHSSAYVLPLTPPADAPPTTMCCRLCPMDAPPPMPRQQCCTPIAPPRRHC